MFILPGFKTYYAPEKDDTAGGASPPAAASPPASTTASPPAAAAASPPASTTASPPPSPPAAATDTGTKKTADTILSDGGTDKTVTTPTDWPADWRQKGMVQAGLPADDKKTLAMLERLTSPGDLVKKVLEQEKIISQGAHKAGLPKDATPEQVTQYRKDNGIPETADKYDLTFADGLVIGEADKPIVDSLLATMHGKNLPNDVVKDLVGAYFAQEKAFLAQRDADISTNKTTQEDSLRQEWGQEYTPNIKTIGNLTKTFSQETRNALAGALDSEGYPLLNNKSFLKDLATVARTINPVDVVVSGNGGDQMGSVTDEIGEIEKQIRDSNSDYWKGPKIDGRNTKMQARYLQLIDWKDRQKKV